MYRKSEPNRLVNVTKKLGAEFSAMEGAPNDRDLKPYRLACRIDDIETGRTRDFEWTRCYCHATGKWYRVNGKHTSTAVASVKSLPPGLQVTICTYEADTLEDVADLYSTFDNPDQTRTQADIVRSMSAAVPEFADIPRDNIQLIARGMSLAIDGIKPPNSKRVRVVEKARRIVHDPQFVLWCNRILGSRKAHRHIYRSPVVAAMYATYQKNRKQAEQFWVLVRDETGPSPSSPDRKLAKWLTSVSIDNGQGATAPKSRKTDVKECLAKCSTAWNAFRRGTTTDLKYFSDKAIPATI